MEPKCHLVLKITVGTRQQRLTFHLRKRNALAAWYMSTFYSLSRLWCHPIIPANSHIKSKNDFHEHVDLLEKLSEDKQEFQTSLQSEEDLLGNLNPP